MEHEYWEERLDGYLDKELDPADHNAVENHISQCEVCQQQVAYFGAMKKRLALHGTTVEMPDAVAERISDLFEKKRKRPSIRWYLPVGIGTALAAAVLMVALLLPSGSQKFEETFLVGKVVCHDCVLAQRAELVMGALCKDGHRFGIECSDGTLWRIVADDVGVEFLKQMPLYGKDVEIEGTVIKDRKVLRIRSHKVVSERQASL